MFSDKKGYRNESYSGSGVRDLEEVLYHEISALGNTDIMIYMNEKYDTKFYMEVFLTEEDTTGLSPQEIRSLIIEEQSLMVVENGAYYPDKVLEYLKQKMNSERLYGIWLTSEDAAATRYGSSGDNEIDVYQIDDDFFPISDLGVDGTLFVTNKPPREYFLKTKAVKV